MNQPAQPAETPGDEIFNGIRWKRQVLIVISIMLAISFLSQQYSNNVLVPRKRGHL